MSKQIITLGTWNNKPIEWIVLNKQNLRILITTRYSIGKLQFDISGHGEWSSSSIRAFLNKDFWNNSFTDNEKKRVINVFLNDVNTKDDVFLISKDESDNYLISSEVNARGYWCTRTKASDYSVVRYSGGWAYNGADALYEIYPSLYIRRDTK